MTRWWPCALYCEKRGSADVAPRVRARGIALGKWVARCRDDYWHGALSAEHTNELESVDGWSWGPRRPGTGWNAFDLLAEYATRRGTAVLTDEARFDDVDLQTWTSAQRLAYAELRLPGTSIQLLEELPGWDWDADAARWVQGLVAARLYIESHGSLEAVIRETQVGVFRLGHWIQRCFEDYRAATMPAARSAALEALPGWSWRQPSLESWSAGLEALQRYISREGRKPRRHRVRYSTNSRSDGGSPEGAATTEPARLAPSVRRELESLPGWQWEPERPSLAEGSRRTGWVRPKCTGMPVPREENASTSTRWATGSERNALPASTAVCPQFAQHVSGRYEGGGGTTTDRGLDLDPRPAGSDVSLANPGGQKWVQNRGRSYLTIPIYCLRCGSIQPARV